MSQIKLEEILEKVDENISDAIALLSDFFIQRGEISGQDWDIIEKIFKKVEKKEITMGKYWSGYYKKWILQKMEKKKDSIKSSIEKEIFILEVGLKKKVDNLDMFMEKLKNIEIKAE